MSNNASTHGTAGSHATQVCREYAQQYGIGHTTHFDAGDTPPETPKTEETAKEEKKKSTDKRQSYVEAFRAALLDEAQQENAFQPPEFLIHNFLPARSVGTLAGAAGAGKSTFLLHLCRCINRGRPLSYARTPDGIHQSVPVGLPRKTGNCVVVTAEDPAGIHNRRKGWDIYHDTDGELKSAGDGQTFILKVIPGLTDPVQMAAIKDTIKDIKPVFVAVDTLAAMVAETNKGGKSADSPENNNSAVTALFTACFELCQEIDASFVFTHHPSQAGNPLRGAYSILASSRFVWLLKQEEGAVKISVHKSNDFDKTAFALTYKLEGVTLSMSEDGHPISIPVLDNGRPKSAEGKTRRALECLVEVAVNGVAPTADWTATMKEAGIAGYRKMRARLVKLGFVSGEGRARGDSNFPAYRLTDKGKAELAAAGNTAEESEEAEPAPAPAERGLTPETEEWLLMSTFAFTMDFYNVAKESDWLGAFDAAMKEGYPAVTPEAAREKFNSGLIDLRNKGLIELKAEAPDGNYYAFTVAGLHACPVDGDPHNEKRPADPDPDYFKYKKASVTA